MDTKQVKEIARLIGLRNQRAKVAPWIIINVAQNAYNRTIEVACKAIMLLVYPDKQVGEEREKGVQSATVTWQDA